MCATVCCSKRGIKSGEHLSACVCCSVLQCVVVCSSMLQCVAVHCSALQ